MTHSRLLFLEAMLLGTPVVAFAVGEVARQIGDARPRFLLMSSLFARKVVNLRTDEDARRRLGSLSPGSMR